MKFICALITVSDIQRSRAFYEGLLEQKVKMDFGENVTFHGDFAIHLKDHYQGLIGEHEIRTGGNNFELYFEYDDVDGMVARLKEHGVTFVHELREQPWRQKVVRFYDPDENIIEVGESMEHLAFRLAQEGLPVDQISEITYMPVDYVIQSVAKYTTS
jgi:catechol 2,3-dioxygenase-like lactoylglutathione lyase family enzyme